MPSCEVLIYCVVPSIVNFQSYALKWEKLNGWEVMSDNKLPLKEHIVVHLEPLTHSSNAILST